MGSALKYLNELNALGSKPGLVRIKELLGRLDNPQDDLCTVHVSGTNGKGSFCAYLSSILTDSSYSVGIFTSPAVMDPYEIIRINNTFITDEKLTEVLDIIAPICNDMEKEGIGHPTRFEIETAAAFMYFKMQGCDICIIECGMGGKDDATNVIAKPECCVFTSISMDHMEYLGSTLKDIAITKSGIITPGSLVISTSQDPAAAGVIEKVCYDRDCDLIIADNKVADEDITLDTRKRELCFVYDGCRYVSKLTGYYQVENAILAITCAKALSQRGFKISSDNIVNGIASAVNPGRFEILSDSPLFIIDGAHNKDAANKLALSLKAADIKEAVFIFAFYKDKQFDEILKILLPFARAVVATETPGSLRALPAINLADYIKEHYDIKVICEEDAAKAVKSAEDEASGLPVIACGTLSDLAIIKKTFLGDRS